MNTEFHNTYTRRGKLNKSAVLREGYLKGLRRAQRVINEQIANNYSLADRMANSRNKLNSVLEYFIKGIHESGEEFLQTDPYVPQLQEDLKEYAEQLMMLSEQIRDIMGDEG